MHLNCVQWFRKAYPHVLAFHVPNGEKRDRRTAEKLKRMGVLPGVADWLMFNEGQLFAIEFKVKKGGVQSDEQWGFSRALIAAGGTYRIAVDVSDFKVLCRAFCGPPAFPWV